MTIWKYPLQITDRQFVMLPEGARILTVQMQGKQLCLWAMMNPDALPKRREIQIIGTGHDVSDADGRYIATVQMQALVWHIFERE